MLDFWEEKQAAKGVDKRSKDECVSVIMREMGWSHSLAVAQMENACARLGISYEKYVDLKLYRKRPEAQEEYYKETVASEEKLLVSRTACIAVTMEETGWTQEQAIEHIEDARTRLGISYRDYRRMGMFKKSPEEQAAHYQAVMAKQKKPEKVVDSKKEKKKLSKNEQYIRKVCKETGWSREQTLAAMDRAKEIADASVENYAVYRFWELTEAQQKTFFTQGLSTKLRVLYRSKATDLAVFRDKVKCCKLLEKYFGRPWLATEHMTRESFMKSFAQTDKIIYKPLTGTGGKGVRVFELPDAQAKEAAYEALCGADIGIVEGFIKQHPDMKRLSVRGVNTLRIATVMTRRNIPGVEKNKVHILYAGLRMAAGDSYVDNLHSGGIIADVDLDTGILKTDGQDFGNHVFKCHPDTGCPIKGFKVPFFDEVKKMIAEAGKNFEAYLGWDVAISETGPVIVEINTSPGAVILQVPYIMQRIGMRHVIEPYLGTGTRKRP